VRRESWLLPAVLVAAWAAHAFAAYHVEVESKTVAPGDTRVVIGVRITNEQPLISYVVPLKVREVTPGSFITRLALSWGGRADTFLTGLGANVQLATENYNCLRGGYGFGDVVSMAADSSRAVGASPEGMVFARFALNEPSLPAGTDVAPSMRLIVDVTSTPGTFEVDTTCTVQDNHLLFVLSHPADYVNIIAVPTFTKGTITIAACICAHHGDVTGDGVIDVLDASSLMDYLFSGGPAPAKDPNCPHVDRGDVDCTGEDDVFDVLYLIDYVFSGGPSPCDPCACNPYPTNCP
jgi:hypothetical protein